MGKGGQYVLSQCSQNINISSLNYLFNVIDYFKVISLKYLSIIPPNLSILNCSSHKPLDVVPSSALSL